MSSSTAAGVVRSTLPRSWSPPRRARDIDEESIGFLTHPTEVLRWEREFRARYTFLGQLDPLDVLWAACDPRRRYEYEQSIT